MSHKIVQTPELSESTFVVSIIGLSCRNFKGFLFMWRNIFSFIKETKNAEGCFQILPGIASPIEIFLVSYWDSKDALDEYVKSKAHLKWMKFIYRNPSSLNLFNETYQRPEKANFINRAGGYSYGLFRS